MGTTAVEWRANFSEMVLGPTANQPDYHRRTPCQNFMTKVKAIPRYSEAWQVAFEAALELAHVNFRYDEHYYLVEYFLRPLGLLDSESYQKFKKVYFDGDLKIKPAGRVYIFRYLVTQGPIDWDSYVLTEEYMAMAKVHPLTLADACLFAGEVKRAQELISTQKYAKKHLYRMLSYWHRDHFYLGEFLAYAEEKAKRKATVMTY